MIRGDRQGRVHNDRAEKRRNQVLEDDAPSAEPEGARRLDEIPCARWTSTSALNDAGHREPFDGADGEEEEENVPAVPTVWSWSFGDSTASTAQNPSHTYSSAGTYTVTLTASNATGASIASQIVMVSQAARAPQPALRLSHPCQFQRSQPLSPTRPHRVPLRGRGTLAMAAQAQLSIPTTRILPQARSP